jgi:hypothetical protein
LGGGWVRKDGTTARKKCRLLEPSVPPSLRPTQDSKDGLICAWSKPLQTSNPEGNGKVQSPTLLHDALLRNLSRAKTKLCRQHAVVLSYIELVPCIDGLRMQQDGTMGSRGVQGGPGGAGVQVPGSKVQGPRSKVQGPGSGVFQKHPPTRGCGGQQALFFEDWIACRASRKPLSDCPLRAPEQANRERRRARERSAIDEGQETRDRRYCPVGQRQETRDENDRRQTTASSSARRTSTQPARTAMSGRGLHARIFYYIQYRSAKSNIVRSHPS